MQYENAKSQPYDRSAPADWDKSAAAKYDHETILRKEQEAQRFQSDYGFDVSARAESDDASGVPIFKIKMTKKTQADIDRENAAANTTTLTDEQRESIRLRRNKKALRAESATKLRQNLTIINKGRSNIGFFNVGDSNIGCFNRGDNNKGFFNIGDYNKGMFCKGNDSSGFIINGTGSRGVLIFGSKSAGVDVWGDKQSGVCQTSDDLMKFRLRILYVVLAFALLMVPVLYNRQQRKRRKRWLKAMQFDESEENIDVMMKRKSF